MDQLTGKTAVVTGAASGIGRAMAVRFGRAGMNVVLADIEEPLLADAAARVEEHGVETLVIPTDVSDGSAIDRLASASIERFGEVNVLCNNAGVAGTGVPRQLGEMDEAEWRWVIDVNMWGVIHGHRAFLPHMLEHGDGHIVNTASMAGHFPGNSPYSVSKWAVVSMSEGLFHELGAGESGIGISCLCPGWVNTRIAESTRNRPEWAAPSALDDSAEETSETFEFVKEALASGLDPDHVANLVHDAVVGSKFWVFTHADMVEALRGRYEGILDGANPEPVFTLD